MSSERFTQKAELALNGSLDYAEKMGASYIGTEHILLSLMETKGSIASKILSDSGLTSAQYTEAIKNCQGVFKKTKLTVKNMTPRARCVLDNAYKNAQKYGALRIGTEHILLSVLEEKDSVASKLLVFLDIDIVLLRDKTRQKIREYERTFGRIEDGERKTRPELSVLLKYGKILNDPSREIAWEIVGRDGVIERIIRTLLRKTKNNPVLLGEAGVGKTAIVEGLAHKILSGEVPYSLSDAIIISLDLTKIVAGTKYRGDFEERIRQILDEAKKNPKVILFIDELHTVMGAGAAEGAVDLANIIKPELSRAEIRVIGATTLEEYRKHIERDSALERRFQPINVDEPSVSDTCKMMRSIARSLEKHHKVFIDDSAITASVELSTRYLFLRSRPDKCIDLLDEGCAYVSIHQAKTSNETPVVTRKDLLYVLEEFSGMKEIYLNVPMSEKNIINYLSENCIGQQKACQVVANGILRSQSGVQDPTRPLGSYFFYGTSGVGKTKMAKTLAKLLFGTEERCITFDMSEYSESHSVSKLIGAPQGYVGYGDGGLLVQKVKNQPYSVLLFDEIEKAHRDIYHIFLQILDEGRLMDSSGKTINFRNCFIVFTSNVNLNLLSSKVGFLDYPEEESIHEIEQLNRHFPTEFLSRIDSFVKFKRLNEENLIKICENELTELKNRLKKEKIVIEYDTPLIDYLLLNVEQLNLGARPIRTKIRSDLESRIAEYVMNHEFEEITLFINVCDGEIDITEKTMVTVG